jgi:hypothetical protein
LRSGVDLPQRSAHDAISVRADNGRLHPLHKGVYAVGHANPTVNEPLFLDGRRIVPDLHWPRQRLVIEADGPHHDDPLERAADKERQRILEAHGYRVVRVTWEQAIAHPAATLRRIDEAGAPRAVG